MNPTELSGPVLRISLALVFLWFGINQLLNPLFLFAYLPEFARQLPIEPATLFFLNGAFETLFGVMLLLGIFTRITAAFLALHMLAIAATIGINEIGVRDFGLAMATFAIALNGNDAFCLSNKLAKKMLRKPSWRSTQT